ncbi:polyprenyl synthetase family protein [Jatrophihabitans telluris]|uniref:Polyprenyl synthetase family protein n=1 Tax=Jatrophihabitans telluris TaxID=2038343 RepID=A0ABY4QUX8_9ACTN|nr:polyprenyl synthetase family protein [Jatrophihabitans telluris]UQX86856.1 polyprenyl synthetase family protein [Jatrophihabitans telluris]
MTHEASISPSSGLTMRPWAGEHAHPSPPLRSLAPGSGVANLAGLSPAASSQLTASLDDALTRFAGPLIEPCARIVHSAGRRLRPSLVLKCGQAGPGTAGAPMLLAAAVELLHCATLVHDDVIDGATTRRGVATINAQEGTSTAIVCGDVLIAAAMGLAADVSTSAAAVMAQTLADLCAGQALEETLRFDVSATEQQVRRVASGKTGSLLRAACLLGAEVAGLEPEVTQVLGRYGTAFGVCLQIVDDVLDVASTPALLGKPVGADVSGGVMTELVVRTLRSRPELAGLLGSVAGSAAHSRALHVLRTSGAIGEMIEAARELAADAGAELADAAPEYPSLVAVASWAGRYVEAQLAEKLDPPQVERTA